MAKARKKPKLVDVTMRAKEFRIDLTDDDGRSTATEPLTPLGIADELDALAGLIETDWPKIRPDSLQDARYCAWRLRDLIQSIGQPDGIIIARGIAGNLHFPVPQGTRPLLRLLGRAREACRRLEKMESQPSDSDQEQAWMAPHEKIQKLAALIRKETPAPSSDTVQTIPASGATAHSLDFRSVRWFGTTYTFTANQARVVKALWNAWEQGTPDVGDETLLQAVDHEDPPRSLRDLFRGHAARGAMIVAGGSKGSHRLAEPGEKL